MVSMNSKITGEDPDAFRRAVEESTEWIIDYFENPEKYPVLSHVKPKQVSKSFPVRAPLEARSFDEILDDFRKKILPGVTHWNHPSFFAYFAISGTFPGILAEFLSAALNVNGMLWRTCPALTELEDVSLGYLRDMLGLDSSFFGLILDTASTSSLLAVAAARETLREYKVRENGMAGRSDLPPLILYTSSEAHSSVEKAAIVLGIGRKNTSTVAVDREFRMRPEDLERKIEEDVEKGKRPFCVVATVGTTSTTSVDPVPEIAALCRKHNLWLHVDAAYAGIAAILPEKRGALNGCDQADSLVVNPHKWLGTPIDLSAFYCRRPNVLKDAFSLVPEYLRTDEASDVTNLMDYGFQLGRRFRALKLWMVINAFGVKGLQTKIREHIHMADSLRLRLEQSDLFEVMAPVPFSTVCFRLNPRVGSPEAPEAKGNLDEELLDLLNERLMKAVNETGDAYLSHTRIHGRFTLRCAIGNFRTKARHIDSLWNTLNEKAREILKVG